MSEQHEKQYTASISKKKPFLNEIPLEQKNIYPRDSSSIDITIEQVIRDLKKLIKEFD